MDLLPVLGHRFVPREHHSRPEVCDLQNSVVSYQDVGTLRQKKKQKTDVRQAEERKSYLDVPMHDLILMEEVEAFNDLSSVSSQDFFFESSKGLEKVGDASTRTKLHKDVKVGISDVNSDV